MRHKSKIVVPAVATAILLCVGPRVKSVRPPGLTAKHLEVPRAATVATAPANSVTPAQPAPPEETSKKLPVPVLSTTAADSDAMIETPTELRKRDTLALIPYPWQQLGYQIVFLPPRPEYRAMTIAGKRRIEVYARQRESTLNLAFDVAHELGHAFDLEINSDERRARWRQLRGIDPASAWFGCNRCSDYDTPAGDFAETFAYLLLGPGSYHSRMAPAPNLKEIPELVEFCRIETNDLRWLQALSAASPAIFSRTSARGSTVTDLPAALGIR